MLVTRGGLFTIGRTTSVRPALIVPPAYDSEGYSRYVVRVHVTGVYAGRKFGRKYIK